MLEKKMKANQKLALERIWRLFELAQTTPEYATRYVTLAKRIGEKCRVSIPKELKQIFCKKCFSLHVATKIEKPFLIMHCNKCGFEKKFGAKEKTKTTAKKQTNKKRTKATPASEKPFLLDNQAG